MAFILDSTNILLMPDTPARTLPTGAAAAARPHAPLPGTSK
jgi:hypothetical protein